MSSTKEYFLENQLPTGNDVIKPGSKESFSAWSSGKCFYKCSVCLIVIYESEQFFRHVRSAHKMSKKMYHSSFSDPCILEVKMTCKICDESLRHDLYTMRKHMEDVHQMELEDYFRKCHLQDTEKPTQVRCFLVASDSINCFTCFYCCQYLIYSH